MSDKNLDRWSGMSEDELWSDLEENPSHMSGIPVMVRDDESEDWVLDVVNQVVRGHAFPFRCYSENWAYARLLTSSERDKIIVRD